MQVLAAAETAELRSVLTGRNGGVPFLLQAIIFSQLVDAISVPM